jgi:DNA-binding Lrp family transcriptional regulator
MKSVLEALPADFPITDRPYETMAREMGITGEQLIREIALLKENGIIRRVSLMVAHRAVSYEGNAMVVWNVPAERVGDVGAIMAGFSEVSHCYERDTAGYWPYNLYTMVHGKTRGECIAVIETMALRSGVYDYRVLFSKREFKKTSFSVRT